MGSASAQPAAPVKVVLDGRIEGPAAPAFVALERGYFKNEGLEVGIEPSPGNSTEAITRVASGAADIGFADINVLIRYRDQNPAAPVKAVFIVNNRPNYAIIGRKSRGVARVVDLEGMRLGAPAAEPATAAWPIIARIRGVDLSKVTVINVGIPVREPMLASGELDAVTGTSSSSPISLRAKGVPGDDIAVLLMAERGLDLYGQAVIVNTKFAAEKPDVVRGFLRAFLHGLKETLRDPDAAVAPVLARMSGGVRELEIERLRATIRDSILTPEVAERGFGDVDEMRFVRALDQIGLGYAYKNKPKPSDIFDPSFLPDASERKPD